VSTDFFGNDIVLKCDKKMLYFLLKIAVQKQNHNFAIILLSNGAKTAPPSCASDSPLITSVRNEDEQMVQILLRFGAKNVNFRTKTGESALSIAAQYGFSNIVKFLISNGAIKDHFTKQHHTPLSLAVNQNHIKVAEILFTFSYDQNNESAWIDPNDFQEGFKHLMPIFNVKSVEMAQLLIDNDARTEDIFDENGKSPLTVAAFNGNSDLIEFFLMHGCNVNHTDRFNRTPIFYAIDQGHHDAIALLIEEAGVIERLENRKRKREGEDDFENFPQTYIVKSLTNSDPVKKNLLSNNLCSCQKISMENEYLSDDEDNLQAQIWRQKWDRICFCNDSNIIL